MDSMALWASPRRHDCSPKTCTTSIEHVSTTVSSVSGDVAEMRSPSYRLRTPPSATITNHKCPNHLVARPCVAGTQTAQHQATLLALERGATNMKHPDSGQEYTSDEITQDSSGFGSLLIGDSGTNSNLLLSSYSRGVDRSTSWQGQSLLTIDSDTSDLPLDQSDLLEQNGPNNCPSTSYTHPSPGGSSKPAKLMGNSSPATNTRQSEEIRGFVEVGASTSGTSSEFYPVSGSQSRILEENLASVARYVEELTGSASTSSGTSAEKSTQRHCEKVHVSPQAQGNCSVGGRITQQQNVFNRTQLKQINQHLAAAKSERCCEKESHVASGSEHLLRLLANQFPELVMVTSNPPENATLEPTNWTTPVVDSTRVPTAHMQSENLPKRHAQYNYQSEQLEIRRSQASSGYSNLASLRVLSEDPLTESGRANLGGVEVSERQLPPEPQDDRYVKQLSALVNNLPVTTRKALLDYYSCSVGDSTNGTTLETATNSFGQCRTTVNDQGSMLSSHRDTSGQTAAAINSLLTSLQDRSPSLSSTPVRENVKALVQPVMVPGAQGTDSESLLLHQTPTYRFTEELFKLAAPYQNLLGALESDIDQAASVYRNSASRVAQKSEAAYHWSGRLPVRAYRSMCFSRKVFLGGVPWDSTTDDLIIAFSRFGNVTVSWPQQEAHSQPSTRGRTAKPKGYCYLIFDHESSVNELLASCNRDHITGGDYYKISSSKFKAKDVQVIPWVISDSQYTKSGPYKPDSKRTVFIGALHGMITAEALLNIMNDLFGNVVFAALDTDKYKYPIGSGRVAFSNHKSYMRAVMANFVDVRTSKFVKTIQIDPYLEDSLCQSCNASPGIYFCRAFECFLYFCPTCWQLWHSSTETLCTHKPLRRTLKPVTDRTWAVVSKF